MSLTHLPYKQAGKIFRSPMPFSAFDHRQSLLQEYKAEGISTVVMLTSDEEALKRTGRDLRTLYRQEGMEVIQLPIPDFDVPEQEALEPALAAAIKQAQAGKHLAIHCYAGQGRTGTFAALLARRLLGLSGEEAIAWTQEQIPGAVESEAQKQLIHDFGE